MGDGRIAEKNRRDWNGYAGEWAKRNHSDEMLSPVLRDPAKAFHPAVWSLLRKNFSDWSTKRICVPSSGDNLAVFAFALLGASVTSCDISENQLSNAKKIADREGIGHSIEWIRTDSMKLDGVADGAYDLVYTSNGVHVWLDDLKAMYQNVYRILKPGGWDVIFEKHPFTRPFDEVGNPVKSYDSIGPFEDEYSVNFHWRMQDIFNAVMDAGIRLCHLEEMCEEKDSPGLPEWFCLMGMRPELKVQRGCRTTGTL